MDINVSEKIVVAKRKGDIVEVENKNPHWKASSKYNHLKVQFEDGSEKSLLFTDLQIKKAIDRASKNTEDLPKVSWLRNLSDKIPDSGLADMQEVVNSKKLPAAALKYNHVRVDYNSKEHNLLFTDKDISVATNRASKNVEDIPTQSWISNILD